MVRVSIWILSLYLFMFVFGGCVNAPPNTSGRVVIQDENAKVDIAFSDHDRILIHDYYGSTKISNYKRLPPGLAKKNKIPPGHRKQLLRYSQLPPGILYQRLPSKLDSCLTPLPKGYVRIMFDGDVILFKEETRVIFDIIHAT